jgi:hypothetical protein
MRVELATEIARLAASIYAALLQADVGHTALFAKSSLQRRSAMQTAISHAIELRRMTLEARNE